MESLQLLQKSETQNNNTEHHTKHMPYFITIEKSGDKKVKIPCANEAIAKKILAGLKKK